MKTLKALLVTLRPRDWVKNGIVIAAWLDSGLLLDGSAIRISLVIFLLLSALASAAYLLNDIVDRERDRQHPTKRFRPIPSGALPISLALSIAVLLAGTAITIGWLLAAPVGGLLTAYFLLQLAYSVHLKHIPFVESISISSGFVLRLMVATAALGVAFSPWLNISCFFTILFMTLRKRRYEITNLEADAHTYRPVLGAYSTTTLDEMIPTFTACSIVFYSIYAVLNPLTSLLALTIPFLAYGILRYHYVADQPELDASGQRIFTLDRPTIFNLLIWIAVAACLIIVFRG